MKKDEEKLSDLISISEASRVRDVSHTAIQDLIERGKLSSIEIGGRRLVRRSEVEAFTPSPKTGRPPKVQAADTGAKKAAKKGGKR